MVVKMLGKTQLLIMIVLLLTCFTFSGVALADTEVSGLISQDTVWDKEGSPYIVKGNILVDTGATLTVNEGVNIVFYGNYYLQVRGSLIARGTLSERISMNGFNNLSSNYYHIDMRSNNNVLDYCDITNNTGDRNVNFIDISGSNNLITNSSINVSGYGSVTLICLKSTSNKITNTNISANFTGISAKPICIDIYSTHTYNEISNCNINGGYIGVNSQFFDSTKLTNNTITNCNKGIYISSALILRNYKIQYNNIYNNLINISSPVGTMELNCTNNYWGTTDKTEIDSKIYDFYDDFNLSKVNYEPYLFVPYGSDLVSSNYPGGTYNNSITVELSVSTGSEIKYTLDGSDPTQSGILYTNPILIDKTLDLKAVSVKDDVCSDISTYSYVIESYGSVQGYVYGITNLSNIQVSLGEYISNTNQTGFYKFDNIPLGKYTLKANYTLKSNYTFCKCNPIDLTIINSEPMNQDLELIPGDFNGDNKIDLFDLVKFCRNYGR